MALALVELKQQMPQVSNTGSLDAVAKALDGITSTIHSKDKEVLQQNLAGAQRWRSCKKRTNMQACRISNSCRGGTIELLEHHNTLLAV